MRKISTSESRRLQELQEKFRLLEPEIEESEIKQALSLINGMVQEIMRSVQGDEPAVKGKFSLKDIADMYSNAPKMDGSAINTPLPAGTAAPRFSLKDANGEKIDSNDLKGSPVVLVFYPLDWSPGCSQQLDLYQNEWDEFERRGVMLLAISVDSIYSHGAWAAVRNLKIPLLSDFNPKGEVARAYRVWREPDGFSERAIFIIDHNGIIRYSYVSPQLNHVPDIYELFRKLDEISKPVNV